MRHTNIDEHRTASFDLRENAIYQHCEIKFTENSEVLLAHGRYLSEEQLVCLQRRVCFRATVFLRVKFP